MTDLQMMQDVNSSSSLSSLMVSSGGGGGGGVGQAQQQLHDALAKQKELVSHPSCELSCLTDV